MNSDRTAAYLFLDPGDTTGWAWFNKTGDIIEIGQFHMLAIAENLDRLVTPDLIKVVCEDYRNHPWNRASQRHWSRNQTSKNIGKIELMCEMRGVPIELVPNTNYPIGYAYMGMEQPSNHAISHQWDAAAHGVYWLQHNGINPAGKFLKGKASDGR